VQKRLVEVALKLTKNRFAGRIQGGIRTAAFS
jgi:hypothetical protein